MQLPLTPPVVLAALLVTGATTGAPYAVADSSVLDPTATGTEQVADVPVDGPAPTDLQAAVRHAVPLPREGACPAYLGPQCDSVAHEQYATGQAIAALGLVGA